MQSGSTEGRKGASHSKTQSELGSRRPRYFVGGETATGLASLSGGLAVGMRLARVFSASMRDDR